VTSSDDVHVGVVTHVLADEADDIFDGIVIETHIGPGGHRFVDAPLVDEIFERDVLLRISGAEAAQLPEPRANPAVMEHHGVEDYEKPLSHKLHRAWEIISGKG
jgi:hypothetical protein